MDKHTLDGKQVLITGATNGIGLAAAEALAARGANVAIVGRNETRARIAAARVANAATAGATVGTFIASVVAGSRAQTGGRGTGAPRQAGYPHQQRRRHVHVATA